MASRHCCASQLATRSCSSWRRPLVTRYLNKWPICVPHADCTCRFQRGECVDLLLRDDSPLPPPQDPERPEGNLCKVRAPQTSVCPLPSSSPLGDALVPIVRAEHEAKIAARYCALLRRYGLGKLPPVSDFFLFEWVPPSAMLSTTFWSRMWSTYSQARCSHTQPNGPTSFPTSSSRIGNSAAPQPDPPPSPIPPHHGCYAPITHSSTRAILTPLRLATALMWAMASPRYSQH